MSFSLKIPSRCARCSTLRGGICYGCTSAGTCIDCGHCAACGGWDTGTFQPPRHWSNYKSSWSREHCIKMCPRCARERRIVSNLYQSWNGTVVCRHWPSHCHYVSEAFGSLVGHSSQFMLLTADPWNPDDIWKPLRIKYQGMASEERLNSRDLIEEFRRANPEYYSANLPPNSLEQQLKDKHGLREDIPLAILADRVEEDGDSETARTLREKQCD